MYTRVIEPTRRKLYVVYSVSFVNCASLSVLVTSLCRLLQTTDRGTGGYFITSPAPSSIVVLPSISFISRGKLNSKGNSHSKTTFTVEKGPSPSSGDSLVFEHTLC